MIRRRLPTIAVLAVLAVPSAAWAHELKPALLSCEQVEGRSDEYDVTWRVPLETAATEAPVLLLPQPSERLSGAPANRQGDALLERFRLRVPGGLAGKKLDVHSSARSPGEVLVRITLVDRRTLTGRIVPGKGTGFIVPAAPTALGVARAYLTLGVEHILGGLDHLAFVLGLILLTPVWRKLWKTVTAFTVAHSLTLALASLGLVSVPSAPVEATIALSILFVAREVYLSAQARSSAGDDHELVPPSRQGSAPWTMAFGFGLLHGLGFAGALSEVGLPEAEIPVALFTFNVGVEIGQLLFVGVVLVFGRAAARLLARVAAVKVRTAMTLLPAYAIGALAAFWCIERVAAFF